MPWNWRDATSPLALWRGPVAGLSHHVGAGRALGGPGCPLRRVLAVSHGDSLGALEPAEGAAERFQPRGRSCAPTVHGPREVGGGLRPLSAPRETPDWPGYLSPAETGGTAGKCLDPAVWVPCDPWSGDCQEAEPRRFTDHAGPGRPVHASELGVSVSCGERNVEQGLGKVRF